jgi:hypothetical protein
MQKKKLKKSNFGKKKGEVGKKKGEMHCGVFPYHFKY